MTRIISDIEHDAEAARGKLANDLAALRSPETFHAVFEELKHQAMQTKDDFVERTKTNARTTVEGFVEDLKAKAAANPMAAVAIGAGLGWKLFRHPPITTILVGVGLASLMRTKTNGNGSGDYVGQAKRNLKRQLADFGGQAGDAAAGMAQAVGDKAGEFAEAGLRKAAEWRDAVATNVAEPAMQAISDTADAANRKVHDAQDAVADMTEGAASLTRQGLSTARDAVRDEAIRDNILLGVAGLAVAAALGLSVQRNIERSD